jgi:outer membrane receptor protein involved in Fe transport
MRTRSLLIIICALVCAAAVAAEPPRYAGQPLAYALRDLQSRGLRLIYSDDVVRKEMIVGKEPRSTEPRRILDELLREHGLRVRNGPGRSLLVVRDEPARREAVPKQSTATAPAPPPEMPVTLAEIVVTPSRFTILSAEPASRQFLSREEVRRLPHFADDLYRAIGRIPGVAAPDVSARFNMRGGGEDEVLVLVDGAEIHDPFHVKDLSRAFSTIDAEAVGSVDVLSGGYPAEYGGRMSGVVDINTAAPDETRHEIGLSLLNARFLSQGTFGKSRGSWLLSVRHGYLREALRMLDEESEFEPRYDDLLGKVQWNLGDSAVISAHVLIAEDHLELHEEPATDARARYSDRYAWLNLRASLTPRLFAQSVLSYGSLSLRRDGRFLDEGGIQAGELDDRRHTRVVSLKNDATYDVSPRNLLKFGATAKQSSARYDYDGSARIQLSSHSLGAPPFVVERSVHVRPSGSEIAAYVADRVRLSETVVVEAGVRAGHASYTSGGTFFDPRLNVAWSPAAHTSVRAAWAIVHQPARIDDLQVEDGVSTFGAAQRSEHRVIGVEHLFRDRVHARVELYEKTMSKLRPRYENAFDSLLIFPELRADRVRIAPERATARGAELLVRTDAAARVSGWMSYTLASVTDVIEGSDVPRTWDQRHGLTFSVNFRQGAHWNVNLAGTYHSGWPTTPVIASIVGNRVVSSPGERGQSRLPAYHRADLRISRSAGPLTLFVDVLNVLNNTNVTRVDGFDFNVASTGEVTAVPRYESVLTVLPSFGVTWRF